MILDYLPGGELIKHIRKSIYMSEENTRFYLAEVVSAVEQLHSMGIIYRDLKPENVLIDRDGHVKLIDFGFAKIMANIKNDRTYTNCGTPGYCAPEVMLAQVGHNYKADIWSIGILICEMIGGFTPFQNRNEAGNPKAIMEKCRQGKLNLPKNLHGNIRDLVKLLLNEDPGARLEIAQIKEHKFFRGLDWRKLKERKVTPPFVPESGFNFDNFEYEGTQEKSYFFPSDKRSATGGTGHRSSSHKQKISTAAPTKVLGDYQLTILNKAFANF